MQIIVRVQDVIHKEVWIDIVSTREDTFTLPFFQLKSPFQCGWTLIKSVICSSHSHQTWNIQCVSLLTVIKIKTKASQFSKVNLSYTLHLWCLSILEMPVASERLISCFTSARDGLEESWKGGKKKGQESRNTLMQIHTVKVICLVFKIAGFPT